MYSALKISSFFFFQLIYFSFYNIVDRQRNEERKSIGSDEQPRVDKEKDKKRKPVASTSRVSNFKENSNVFTTHSSLSVYLN